MGKWLKRVVILILLLAAAGYFGIPYLVQTSWARDKVKAALEKNTGRDVDVGSISFGWGSGLQVHDVVVKQAPADSQADGPLFSLGALSLKVGLGDLLSKTIRVDELNVEKARIVIIRDRNGRFNFADLVEKPAESGPETAPAPAPGPESAPAPKSGGAGTKVVARLDIADGTILYIDEQLGTRIEASGITAAATWHDGKFDLDLSSDLNGGLVKLVANADLGTSPAPFTVKEFRIEGAEFDSNLAQLGLFLPLAGDAPQQASGKISFHLADMSGTGLTLDELERTLTAAGGLSLSGGALVSGPVTQIYSALKAIGAGDLSSLGATADEQKLGVNLLSSTFDIRDGKIVTDDMKLDGAGIQLTLAGWTSLDGRMDYKIVAGGLDKLIAKNEQIAKYLGDQKTLPLNLTGTLASPAVKVDAKGALEGAIRSGLEKEIKDRLPGGIKLPGGK